MLYASLTLFTVGEAGCTLPGELESMKSLTVFEIGDVACKSSHDNGCTCKVLDMSHLDLDEIALVKLNT